MTEDQIKHMTERFLAWKIPVDFSPDNGIAFEPLTGRGTPYEFRREPTGTNLFSYTQAEAMVRHMLAGLPRPERADAGLAERLSDEADLCRNDGANDIAELLDEAKAALRAQPPVDAIDAEGVAVAGPAAFAAAIMCDWPVGEPFTFRDEPGEHDPCYVVMPGGAMLPLNHHAGEGVDVARAKFIVDACNAALARTTLPKTAEIERLRYIVKWAADDFETLSKVYGVLTDSDRSHFSKYSAKFRAALASTDQGEG